MKRRIRRQLAILWAGLFAVSVWLLGESLNSGITKSQVAQTNANLEAIAQLYENQFESYFEMKMAKARMLFEVAKQRFENRSSQIYFIENQLAMDPSLLSLTVYQKGKEWEPRFQVSRPRGETYRLGLRKLYALNRKFPLQFEKIENNREVFEFRTGVLEDQTPILRVAKRSGKTLIIGLDVFQESIQQALVSKLHDQKIQVLAVNDQGQLLFQSANAPFEINEDLSHLPIFQNAFSASTHKGSLLYHMFPSSPLTQASFFKSGASGLTIATQAPYANLKAHVQSSTKSSLWFGVVLFLGIGLVFGFAFETVSKETVSKKANPTLNPTHVKIKDAA